MKGKNKEEFQYTIKVNKTLINKKNNGNTKNMITPIKTNNTSRKISDKIVRSTVSEKDIKNLAILDLDSNEKSPYKKYSQKTYTCKYYSKDNSYKIGNIFYDMQTNKYLKPILNSKDIQNKLVKCIISEPKSNFLSLNNNSHYNQKYLSEYQSPHIETNNAISFFKERYNINNNLLNNNNLTIKNENIKFNNIYSILKKIKTENSNCPYYFSRNDINKNKEYLNNNNNSGVNVNSYNINSVKNCEKQNKTCKQFYKKLFNHENNDNKTINLNNYRNRLIKFNSYSSLNDKYKKIINEKISYFCNILEIFFLNIIKKIYKKLISQLNKIKIRNKNKEINIYKFNSEEANTRRNTLYDSDTIKSYKNPVFDNENALKSKTFSNIYCINNIYNYNTNRFDSDIIEKSKEKQNTKIDKIDNIMKNKLDNNLKRFRTIENNNYTNYKRYKNKYFIIKQKDIDNSDNLLIYHKKNNFTKNSEHSLVKDEYKTIKLFNTKFNSIVNNDSNEKNKTINASINAKNKTRIIIIKNKKKSDGEIFKKKKLYMNFKNYTLNDINYYKNYINKYKYKKKNINNNIKIFRNINFSIIINNKIVLYKKIKINKIDHKRNNTIIYESNSNLNKRKKVYNISIHSIYRKDSSNIRKSYDNNTSYNRKRNSNNNNICKAPNYYDRNTKINKIIINCVKFLSKIIRKLFVRKYFILLRKKLNI